MAMSYAQGQDFTFTLCWVQAHGTTSIPKYSMSLGPEYMHVSNSICPNNTYVPAAVSIRVTTWDQCVGRNGWIQCAVWANPKRTGAIIALSSIAKTTRQ